MFTLLYTDGQRGLEICPEWEGSGVHRDDKMHSPSLSWTPVEHKPGYWIVNLGTLLTHWSDGQFRSTLHRVMSYGDTRTRYSLPFFYESNIDAPIRPLSFCKEFSSHKQYDSPKTTGDILIDLAKQAGLELQPV